MRFEFIPNYTIEFNDDNIPVKIWYNLTESLLSREILPEDIEKYNYYKNKK